MFLAYASEDSFSDAHFNWSDQTMKKYSSLIKNANLVFQDKKKVHNTNLYETVWNSWQVRSFNFSPLEESKIISFVVDFNKDLEQLHTPNWESTSSTIALSRKLSAQDSKKLKNS